MSTRTFCCFIVVMVAGAVLSLTALISPVRRPAHRQARPGAPTVRAGRTGGSDPG